MLNFQEMIAKLTTYWSNLGCAVHQGYDLEVGAGTFNPATFLRSLGPEPYSAVYVEPSRRPQDARYGDNPNRVQFYHQMQVILKPSPEGLQELYLGSLEAVGLDLKQHDIRFVHDDWENPTIGAWGLGWEIWIDGMEVTQFTYFQTVGGVPVKPVSGELTYGLERLAMYLQKVDSIFDIRWNGELTFGDIFKRSEWEWSHYNFQQADTKMWQRHFEDFEKECIRLIRENLPIPAYDFVMKASHAFNILDARGVISITERTGYISRIRSLAKQLAEAYIRSREEQKFPLLKSEKPPLQTFDQIESSLAHWSPDQKEDFLLEIGSEELPALFVPVGLSGLERGMRNLLSEHGLQYESLKVYGTPRRLTVYVKQLAGGTHPQTIERKGPSVNKAFDASGNPTQIGKGFFSSLGIESTTLAQLKHRSDFCIKEVKGSDYLFATIELSGKSSHAILSEHLPNLILSIDFPKRMRWGNEEITYARPLRWIVALLGTEEIPFTLGSIRSGRVSQGHRLLSPVSIQLKSASDYFEAMNDHFVLVDVEARKQKILGEIHEIEATVKGNVIAADRVLPQVLHLVEWPFLTVAAFDSRYLSAPQEVLISEMVEHQKYFPITHLDGTLQSKFVIVCNTRPSDTIRKGNERALSPRLADGVFLYNEDLKIPMDALNEKLKGVTFQKELGSMWQKVERIKNNVEILHSYLPISPLGQTLRAASLCKADLASELVKEFPELQGIIGRYYALHQKEDPEVAKAIDEHWMPRGEKSPLPQTPCGILVNLADKFDNFLSCYALGLKPTSSSDPYALRRQALGMIKMLIDGQFFLPFQKVLNQAYDAFLLNSELAADLKNQLVEKKGEIFQEIEQFFSNRLRTLLNDDFEKDEIEAVLPHGIQDIYDVYRRTEALHSFRNTNPKLFQAILETYTRTKKILFSQNRDLIPGWQVNRRGTVVKPENRNPPVDSKLFEDESETKLYRELEEIKKLFHPNLVDRRKPETRDYAQALSVLSKLQIPVASLFDRVKVIADDSKVRQNRLSLLQEVWDLCEELVDFSKIQEI